MDKIRRLVRNELLLLFLSIVSISWFFYIPDSLRSVGIKHPMIVMESAAVGSAAVLGFLMARKSRCPVFS